MNVVHVHLVATHLPVTGIIFGFCLLMWGVRRRSGEIVRVSWGWFVVCALLALPAYLSGEPTAELVKGLVGVKPEAIEQHEELAEAALAGVLVVGVVSLAALIVFRSRREPPGWSVLLILLLVVLAGGLLGWTANLGGRIRHPEMQTTAGPRGGER